MIAVSVSLEDISGVDEANVEANDLAEALDLALVELGDPLEGRDEGSVTLRIRVTS